MKKIELAIIDNDIRWVDTHLLALKFAGGFHGAAQVIAEIVSENQNSSTEAIAEVIETEGRYITDTNGIIQPKTVLFLQTPPLHRFHYPQIREFASRVLELCSDACPNSSHISMTIHGPNYGLTDSICFLAQISGIINAISLGLYPEDLEGISIVERDPDRANILSELLKYRLLDTPYALSSATGAVQFIDTELLQSMHQL